MTTNTLDQIKQTEAEAQKMIEQARQKVEISVLQAEKDGEKSLADAENQVPQQIEKIVEAARKEIQLMRNNKEKELANQLQKLTDIDDKTLDQAAKLVVKETIR